jgi:hypothetical protein
MAEINNARWRRNWHRLILEKVGSTQVTPPMATTALQSTDHAASWRCSDGGFSFHGHKSASAASENMHVVTVTTEHGKLGGRSDFDKMDSG